MTNAPDGRPWHGTSKITEVKKDRNWLPWIIGLLILLILTMVLARSCAHRATPPAHATGQTLSWVTPPVAVETVILPGGRTIVLKPHTLNYELQRFLASSEATPRKFTFDRLNFATNSARLPADARSTVSALAQILTAFPNATVELQGYADSTGAEPHNAQLGAHRAEAVEQALIAQGVAADRMKTATGGSSHPTEPNATVAGRAENRRTELLVTAK